MVRSFKLRFVHRHVRIEVGGGDAGVDLVDADAEALFALAGPLVAAASSLAPGATVRAISVDLEAPRLLASLDGEGAPPAVRLDGIEALGTALEAAAPLLSALQAAADASLERRSLLGPLVRSDPSAARASDLSLVLTAVGVPHHLEEPAAPGEPFQLRAPAERADEARSALDAYDAENRPTAPVADERDYGETLIGACFALLLLGWFAAIDFVPHAARWVERGAAEAARIVAGEWWRTATALTLHADAAHAGGNAALGGIALTALARRLGPGAAAWIALSAGVIGNALTALAHRRGFVSVGASTAVFGLLGALAGALAVRSLAVGSLAVGGHTHLRTGARRRGPFVALAASAALLGLLGAGERADLLAHLFGMGAGFAAGAAGAALIREPPQRSALQPALAASALVFVALCWWRAMS